MQRISMVLKYRNTPARPGINGGKYMSILEYLKKAERDEWEILQELKNRPKKNNATWRMINEQTTVWSNFYHRILEVEKHG